MMPAEEVWVRALCAFAAGSAALRVLARRTLTSSANRHTTFSQKGDRDERNS